MKMLEMVPQCLKLKDKWCKELVGPGAMEPVTGCRIVIDPRDERKMVGCDRSREEQRGTAVSEETNRYIQIQVHGGCSIS